MADVQLPRGDISTWDDDTVDQEMPPFSPMMELGVTGLKRVSGYVNEEFLPALQGRKAVRVFKEMSTNDSMVGALLFAIDKLIREVEWKVVPADQTEENALAADFLESCMDDMSHSWDDFIGEVLSMLPYGWSWHELVFKRRIGPWETDPAKKSKYDDGLFGIRKMPIRAQETLMRWSFDETGGIQAMVQMAPPRYETTIIPIKKSLLFRTSIAKGNPEGVSLLRTAYRSWYFKKRLEEFEAIGVERDLAGMPVARVPADYLNAVQGTRQQATVEAFKKMVRGVRRDENEGLLLPSAFDPDTKQQLFEFELMSSSGSRQFDTNSIIQRYEQRILMSVLADFILVGHQEVGSYSLHTDKTGIFRAALNAITKSIADTLNRHLVPKLFEINGWKMDELPHFEPSNIDPPDLGQLAQFITATAGAGMQWFPDPELEKFVRDIARLPEMTEETEEYKRQMLHQQQAMEFADSQMGLMGMKQKADMIAQGLTPEQAQMQSEQPTGDMMQQQATNEQDAELVRRQHPVGQQDMAMQQEQMAMQNQPPPEDPNAAKQHKRDQEKASLADRHAGKAHTRDTQKMKLQEKFAERAHRRDMAASKQKALMDEKKAKMQMMAQKKSQPARGLPAKKAPAKKPGGKK